MLRKMMAKIYYYQMPKTFAFLAAQFIRNVI